MDTKKQYKSKLKESATFFKAELEYAANEAPKTATLLELSVTRTGKRNEPSDGNVVACLKTASKTLAESDASLGEAREALGDQGKQRRKRQTLAICHA